MLFKRILLLVLTVATFSLVGCQTPSLFYETENNVADVKERTTASLHQSDKAAMAPAPLVVDQGLYIDKTPVDIARSPSWLHNHIVMRGEQLPFSYYSRTAVSSTGALTNYQTGLDPTVTVTMNYSGDVKGALDFLAAKTGYIYKVDGNNITWLAYVTKTFNISFMPGSSDYLMGKTGGGKAASGAANVTDVGDPAADQYSNLRGNLSVWKDLRESLNDMKSPEGHVMVSEATTTVTVRDKPSNVEAIEQYIQNLNKNLSKQVLIKVQILDVSLQSDFNYGVNWSIVANAFGHSKFVLNANYGTPVSITPFGGVGLPSGGLQGPLGSDADGNPLNGLTILLNALKQQGKVSVVTQPRVVALNNQVSVIRIVNQRGYIASVQNTTSTAGGGGVLAPQTTTEVNPGTVVSGLTLYLLPKIMGNRVYLQVNADLSTLVNIDDLFTQGSPAKGAATGNNIRIQAPRLSSKQFNQRSVIGSGDTLILAGFRQVNNNSGAMQFLDSQTLGGRAASQQNLETIVLITPIILHGFA